MDPEATNFTWVRERGAATDSRINDLFLKFFIKKKKALSELGTLH